MGRAELVMTRRLDVAMARAPICVKQAHRSDRNRKGGIQADPSPHVPDEETFEDGYELEKHIDGRIDDSRGIPVTDGRHADPSHSGSNPASATAGRTHDITREVPDYSGDREIRRV